MTATNTAQILVLLSNAATSAPAAIMGAGGMSAGGILASNMVNSRAKAIVEDGSIGATRRRDGRSVRRGADRSRATMESKVEPANNAGAGILNKWANQSLAEYKFTQHSGTRDVVFGDKVRADDGTIYQYMGTPRSIDLLAEDYSGLRLLEGAHAGQPDQRLGRVRGALGLGTVGEANELLPARRPQRPAQHGRGAPAERAGHDERRRQGLGDRGRGDDGVRRERHDAVGGQRRRHRHERDALERQGVRPGRRRHRRERDCPRRERLDDGRHRDLEDRVLGQP